MSDELEQEIESLRRMSRQQLRDRWRALYKAAPPAAFAPDLLARGIAWRLQETALGGLSADARRLLRDRDKGRSPKARPALRPGNRLVRRWRGCTYVVEAVEGGFTFDGVRFGSLSEIAKKITGTRWSGPRFFGLVQ
jgi:DUF2924 family protein